MVQAFTEMTTNDKVEYWNRIERHVEEAKRQKKFNDIEEVTNRVIPRTCTWDDDETSEKHYIEHYIMVEKMHELIITGYVGRAGFPAITKTRLGCWICGVKANKKGYCPMTINNKTVLMHRLSIAFFGGVSKSDEVSHLCHQPSCINPDHLRYESRKLNIERQKCNQKKKCNKHKGADDCLFELI